MGGGQAQNSRNAYSPMRQNQSNLTGGTQDKGGFTLKPMAQQKQSPSPNRRLNTQNAPSLKTMKARRAAQQAEEEKKSD